jgi:hypothetical protein
MKKIAGSKTPRYRTAEVRKVGHYTNRGYCENINYNIALKY